MIVLLSLISVIALLFIFLDGICFQSRGKISPGTLAVLVLISLAAFLLPGSRSGKSVQILSGLLLLVYSFILLGIIPARSRMVRLLKQHSYWGYAPMVSLLWAVSGLQAPLPLTGTLLFLLLLTVMLFPGGMGVFYRGGEYRTQNVKKILELFHLLGGIFQFITGLVIASDRVRFFEKMVDYFF